MQETIVNMMNMFQKQQKTLQKMGFSHINHAAIGAFGLSHDCGNPYAITERPLVAKQLQRGALQLGLGDPNLKPASYTCM